MHSKIFGKWHLLVFTIIAFFQIIFAPGTSLAEPRHETEKTHASSANDHNILKAFEFMTQPDAIKKDASNIYMQRAQGYLSQNQFDLAIEEYNKAIKLDPNNANNANAYSYRGYCYGKKHNLNMAIQDFSKALELDPANAYAYSNRGIAFAYSGNYDLAINDFNKSLSLNPNDALCYYSRGLALFKKSDSDFKKAVSLDPALEKLIVYPENAVKKSVRAKMYKINYHLMNIANILFQILLGAYIVKLKAKIVKGLTLKTYYVVSWLWLVAFMLDVTIIIHNYRNDYNIPEIKIISGIILIVMMTALLSFLIKMIIDWKKGKLAD